MLENAEKKFKQWKLNEKYDIRSEVNMITFNIFTTILFGDDTKDIVLDHNKKLSYINQDNQIEELKFQTFFGRVFMDFVFGYYNPLSRIFPFLNHYNLVNPFKRNKKNCDTMRQFLSEALKDTKDENSAYKKGLSQLDDLIIFMVAGSDTTSFTMSSALYLLKKNPKVLEKLKKELEIYGISPGCDPHKDITVEKVQKIDYLGYVIKEALRLDGPAVVTFPYKVYQDVTI